ncbi:hypothetical protein ACVW00_004241 [Marmoricola sp. URHA0025 HA25]
MSPFATFVSRRMAAALAAFAVIAALLVGYVAVRDAGGSPDGSDLNAQLVDPTALQAALDDPAAAGTVAADDPAGGRAQLRADLRAAFKLEGDARRAALASIRQKARDGGYGNAVERRADRRQIRHELFLSLLPDNLQADLTRLQDAPADQRAQLRSDIMDKAVAGDYGPDVQKAAEQLRGLHKT